MYEHDYKGVAVFGDLDSLTSAVTTGDIIRVVIHHIHDFQVVASLVLGFARSRAGLLLSLYFIYLLPFFLSCHMCMFSYSACRSVCLFLTLFLCLL